MSQFLVKKKGFTCWNTNNRYLGALPNTTVWWNGIDAKLVLPVECKLWFPASYKNWWSMYYASHIIILSVTIWNHSECIIIMAWPTVHDTVHAIFVELPGRQLFINMLIYNITPFTLPPQLQTKIAALLLFVSTIFPTWDFTHKRFTVMGVEIKSCNHTSPIAITYQF